MTARRGPALFATGGRQQEYAPGLARRERPFRTALGAQLVLFALIRGYYRWRASRSLRRASWREGRFTAAVRGVSGLMGLAALLIYLIRPERLRWAALPLPHAVRWAGVGLGTAGLGLLLASHRALGANFAATLHVTDRHTLVTTGPYRWVRHPMYTALGSLLVAFSVVSANWFAGLIWLAEATIVIACRVGREEALMEETFGEGYREYARRTGRFLPLPGRFAGELR